MRDLPEDDVPETRQPPWLNKQEFLEQYHMHQESFRKLVELTKHTQYFIQINNEKQPTIKHQLMVFLQYLGNSGSGGSNPHLRTMFQIGCGTADKFKYDHVSAIHSL